MSFFSYGQLVTIFYTWEFIKRYGLIILFFGVVVAGLIGIGYLWGRHK